MERIGVLVGTERSWVGVLDGVRRGGWSVVGDFRGGPTGCIAGVERFGAWRRDLNGTGGGMSIFFQGEPHMLGDVWAD
jgi:hypothetical protein